MENQFFGRIGSSKKAAQKKSNYELRATFELGFVMFSWSENYYYYYFLKIA
jgi:hypothetical protein